MTRSRRQFLHAASAGVLTGHSPAARPGPPPGISSAWSWW